MLPLRSPTQKNPKKGRISNNFQKKNSEFQEVSKNFDILEYQNEFLKSQK